MLTRTGELNATPGQVFQVTHGSSSLFTPDCVVIICTDDTALFCGLLILSYPWQPPFRPRSLDPHFTAVPTFAVAVICGISQVRHLGLWVLWPTSDCDFLLFSRSPVHIQVDVSAGLQSCHAADAITGKPSLASLLDTCLATFKNTPQNDKNIKLGGKPASPSTAPLASLGFSSLQPQQRSLLLAACVIERLSRLLFDFLLLVKAEIISWTINLIHQIRSLHTFSKLYTNIKIKRWGFRIKEEVWWDVLVWQNCSRQSAQPELQAQLCCGRARSSLWAKPSPSSHPGTPLASRTHTFATSHSGQTHWAPRPLGK